MYLFHLLRLIKALQLVSSFAQLLKKGSELIGADNLCEVGAGRLLLLAIRAFVAKEVVVSSFIGLPNLLDFLMIQTITPKATIGVSELFHQTLNLIEKVS
ncbi:hypothetical protein COLO4_03985 [Corchorus olitorius]|uniref:Uncharacterized protein n=1 Tax=Corchorus olitorius TaxID=93759 RepID=A0A1R3KVV0_9ROSI|nr:hypothetical protein COLO4_03985 [Corchorus olitorius]